MRPYEQSEHDRIVNVAEGVLQRPSEEVTYAEAQLAAFALSTLQHYERLELEAARLRQENAEIQLLVQERNRLRTDLTQTREVVRLVGRTLEAVVTPLSTVVVE